MSWGTPGRFDTIVLPITAIVGDQGELKEVIKRSAADLGRRADEVTPVDAWGAVSSYRNVGFDSWAGTDDSKELFTQARAQGLLGGVRKLITERDPALKVALAVGAWKTSEAFHELAKSPARRATFIDSLADIVKRFPMITAVVLDWEYPGRPGRGNPHGPQDAANYALLIRELKQKLPAVRISVTLGASVETLEAANVPALVAAGADQLHLMAYDYFGTPWSKALGHTANLRVTESAENSVDAAVSFPLDQGVASRTIHRASARSATTPATHRSPAGPRCSAPTPRATARRSAPSSRGGPSGSTSSPTTSVSNTRAAATVSSSSPTCGPTPTTSTTPRARSSSPWTHPARCGPRPSTRPSANSAACSSTRRTPTTASSRTPPAKASAPRRPIRSSTWRPTTSPAKPPPPDLSPWGGRRDSAAQTLWPRRWRGHRCSGVGTEAQTHEVSSADGSLRLKS
ncbi:glycosyl hydrolase family 18 protein [Kitasatospora gansuensis]|uniref:glycosyl hydrolase family 18 protein n=1 Tax=Kitasatospora gansuensis TaxID=258050 RepID=UPI0035E42296